MPSPFRCLAIAVPFIFGGAAAFAQPALNIERGVVVSWPTQTNFNYQLQSSGDSGATWVPLGGVVAGDGTTNTLYDSAAGGARAYQILEMTPAIPGAPAIPANSGFEFGDGGTASNWSVTTAAGGPVYTMRTNSNPHSGSFHYEIYLASAGAGPVVEFSQPGIPVTGGTVYPLTFYSDALAGSAGYSAQWRILWNAGGDTGYQGFSPGTGAYSLFTHSVTAPPSATSATVFIHVAGAATAGATATIDFDDFTLGSGSGAGTPGVTNVLAAGVQPVAKVSWLTASGTQYQPTSTTNLASGIWSSNFPVVMGDGGVHSILFSLTNSPLFFRLCLPAAVILPPANLAQITSGMTNAIGLAWTPASTPGVTGYRVVYGLSGANLDQSLSVGNVATAVIPNLTAGQTYYLAVYTETGAGQSASPSGTITAQPDTTVGMIPLFDAATTLEPDTVSNTPTALITRIADRPRARHARESEFMLYDTYLIFYWEQRMTDIEIIDTLGKGGSSITFNLSTLNALDQPNIRFFFQGQTTVAQYSDNLFADEVGASGTNWTSTITMNNTFNRPLQVGDRIEFEFSPFMLTVTNGQLNYYGGAILYIAGRGIVPWQEGVTNDPGSINAALDSTPIPTNGWLAGDNTMPYQYSAESNHLFNQLSPHASPPSGQSFVLGRRLHETDFGDGSHAEAGNPIYPEQAGKLGPKFSNRSCVACHANNGRALPPAIGQPMLKSVVRVGSDAGGAPDPVLGSVLQPQATSGAAEDGVSISSYTTINGQYGDGAPYTLQKPNYAFTGRVPAFYSVRLAPQLVGMGLLEAVSESTVQSLADADNAGTNGISGRLQVVTDPETQQLRLGRFGYKGGKARVRHQIAGALNTDMGVTTSIYPVLDGETNSGPVELGDGDLANWTRYISCLGVNARRNLADAQCLRGEQLFTSANCVQCHTPTMTTSAFHPIAELRNQIIHPYTDLLLHDLGPGLADNMGEGEASGSQWRTSPLWSIGLTSGESGGEAYLHDGRARTLEEAILWHDGEAAASKEAFRTMTAADRAALVAFLKSL